MAGSASTLPRKQAQTRIARSFGARSKKRLQAQADAEQRNAACNGISKRCKQTARAQRPHELAEVADAGKDQGLSGANGLRSGRAFCLDALPGERALDRRQITGVIFDERDLFRQRFVWRTRHIKPFVLGRTRFSCGSRVAANRSARAKALKSAST